MSEIKKVFMSRFGKDGQLVEADFSQLEVVVVAFLSQDPQLIFDINNKVDTHSINAANLFGPSFTDKQRKIAKQLSFQLQYGAGYKSMAKKNKIPEAVAKQFIDNFYNRYPRVKEWQEENIRAVEKSRKISDKRTDNGMPAGKGELGSITGRKYVFYEKDSLPFQQERGMMTSFNPATIKNYPVQGFAGDLVQLVLGKLYRKLITPAYAGKALLVNTVHDSILLDVRKELVDDVARIVKQTMEEGGKYLEQEFDINFNLPLRAEVKVGDNWLNLQEITV